MLLWLVATHFEPGFSVSAPSCTCGEYAPRVAPSCECQPSRLPLCRSNTAHGIEYQDINTKPPPGGFRLSIACHERIFLGGGLLMLSQGEPIPRSNFSQGRPQGRPDVQPTPLRTSAPAGYRAQGCALNGRAPLTPQQVKGALFAKRPLGVPFCLLFDFIGHEVACVPQDPAEPRSRA